MLARHLPPTHEMPLVSVASLAQGVTLSVLVVSRPKAAADLAHVTHMDAFTGAPSPALILFAAVPRAAFRASEGSDKLERFFLGTRPYIGFRESADPAMDRAKKVFCGTDVNKNTFVILKISLSAEAVAHFTVTSAGAEHQFAPMLHKRTYSDENDWKVWHFCADFPLRFPGVLAEWLEIE